MPGIGGGGDVTSLPKDRSKEKLLNVGLSEKFVHLKKVARGVLQILL